MSKEKISRRKFLKGTAGSIGIGAVAAMVGGAAAPALAAGASAEPVTAELPIPKVDPPQKTEYTCDILVVGTGYTGMPAAIEAKKAGKNVLMVDKGYPGYSGSSPFPQCFQFFDARYGDTYEGQLEATKAASEYTANLDWYRIYLDESRGTFDKLVEWGIYRKFPSAIEAGGDYFEKKRFLDYHDKFKEYDRREAWRSLPEKNGIECVTHTMLYNVIVEGGKVVGALGFHVPSGTPIVFHCKAVILAMGAGIYKNGGWPVGGATFDGAWIGYQAGAPISGKEFTYQMQTSAIAPTCGWFVYNWGILENMHATGSPYLPSKWKDQAKAGSRTLVNMLKACQEGAAPVSMKDLSSGGLGKQNAVESTKPDEDPRMIGNNVSPMPTRTAYGAAIGKSNHQADGIFCGVDDTVGYTGVPGLYAAGATLASYVYGGLYTAAQGGCLPVCMIQGIRSAKAASEYCGKASLGEVDNAKLEEMKKEMLAPMNREKGYNPIWAQDALMGIMAPYWVNVIKTETTLTGALNQVLELKKNVVPKLLAKDSHDLRGCHEVIHKILDAEIKLRLSLARKESRGLHYRADYPNRNDAEFLCYLTAKKGADGSMVISKVQLKDEWKGDLTAPYAQRYPVRLPGEKI